MSSNPVTYSIVGRNQNFRGEIGVAVQSQWFNTSGRCRLGMARRRSGRDPLVPADQRYRGGAASS